MQTGTGNQCVRLLSCLGVLQGIYMQCMYVGIYMYMYVRTYLYMYVGIYRTRLPRAGCNKKVNFLKRSSVWLNLKFSFSKTGCLTKTKEVSLSYYLSIAGVGVGNSWIHDFLKCISTKWNANSLVQDLNSDRFLQQ